jgi:hypothetical protein
MRYDEFLQLYKAAYEDWSLGRVDAGAEIGRLRRLVPQIDEVDRRSFAEHLLSEWTAESSPQARDRMARASAALARAGAEGGPDEERIERAREGRREIAAIAAETDDPNEKNAILAMNESLTMLIESFDRR